ncbi:cell division protein FtsZ [Sphingomonas desiccabilis]|uniref:Cell division protein FtsZ n=1 Tax=Sphingomonas desiccabilis TaxID=429134 RepID=A0A4Q2IU37_9SPHN|nr:cell division protein FtsZ [Sphingomonas desiccabilis]MBB3911309.1 cell division protein FtsZ [Sphingomonas desiccabilis]RXZ31898.1 cell division protein FtsZ [Sphingomonas desiccabilis]
MSIEFLPPDLDDLTPRISVIGVGGAGGNAIANMIRADVQGVEFLVANTDAQALKQSEAPQRIQLGVKITQGLGAGSRPEIGRAAAEETIEQVQEALQGAHMCFIAAGMGGGTGTGAAPVIAKAAREMGILTVGVVTKPFSFEGKKRARSADAGIEELQKYVDTLIVIPNQNLFLIANANTTFKQAFEMADEVLQQGVRGITDLMVMPGLINLDFADVRSVMQEMGKAMMGTGEAEGDSRAIEAAQKAIANPLLDGVSLNGAKGVIVSITGGDDMRLLEVDEAANHIRELVDDDANIIWGSAFNPELEGKIRVSVVATGIEASSPAQQAAAAVAAEPARTSFSFGGSRRPAPASEPQAVEAPVQPAPQPAPVPQAAAPQAQPVAAPQPVQAAQPAPQPPVEDDELVLGADTMVPQQAAAPAPAPKPSADEPRPGFEARRRWLTPGTEAPAGEEQGSGRSRPGGTLFERMANAGRAPARGEETAKEPLDIPRFLHRQNNQ